MGRFATVLGVWATLAVACAPEEPMKVVTTTTTLKSIAEAVGGEHVKVVSIASGVQDPHFVEPKPTYMTLLRDAQVLCVSGLELEIGWIPPLIEGARNPHIRPGSNGYCDCSAGVAVIEIPPAGTTRAEGDVHRLGNPHYLLDPLNAKLVARTMAERFSARRPEAAEAFQARCEEFCERIDVSLFGEALVDAVGGTKLSRLLQAGELWEYLDKEFVDGEPLSSKLGGWLRRMAPARGKPMVTYHKNFSYFAARFDVVVAGYIEPKPGIAPSAAHLVDLMKRMQDSSIQVLVRMGYNESKSTDLLAEKTGAKVLVLPENVGGAEGADDYFKLMDLLTDRIAGAFEP